MSIIAANTSPQFAAGPQKCTVLGPTGLYQKAFSAEAISGGTEWCVTRRNDTTHLFFFCYKTLIAKNMNEDNSGAQFCFEGCQMDEESSVMRSSSAARFCGPGHSSTARQLRTPHS